MELEGRVAVVTGGSSGIGDAVAKRLREAGAKPVVWDVKVGADVACDVAKPDSVRFAMEKTLAEHAAPSVLVTCAGTGGLTPVLDLSVEEWDRIFAVNLRGTMLCVQAVAREMVERQLAGSVVCISSLSARVVDPGMSAYSASKAGILLFAQTAALELGPKGIRVNCVAPGVTNTPMLAPNLDVPGFAERARQRTPLGRIGSPDDVAGAVMALLAADWVTGQCLEADGGLGLASAMDAEGLRRGRG